MALLLMLRGSLARRTYAVSARSFQPGPPTRGMVVPPRGNMDVPTFLKAVGRDCEKLTDKFPTWESLMGSTRDTLVGLGVKVQQRKWLLNWIDKYRQGVDPYLIPPRPPKVREKKGKTTMQR